MNPTYEELVEENRKLSLRINELRLELRETNVLLKRCFNQSVKMHQRLNEFEEKE